MFEIRQTETFKMWRLQLKDDRVRALIASRIDRLAFGHFGDAKSIGDGISELRIHYGPGFRVYFTKHGKTVMVLLCGGQKSTQAKDIRTAKRLILSIDFAKE